MCTAITFNAYGHYFGRNLDLEKRYDESITITPRNYILKYKSCEIERRHFAFIGTATVVNNYPLYYDATNEHGLSIAGLNFVGNAYLSKVVESERINLAPYELIPYILGKCTTVKDSINILKNLCLVDLRFGDDIPNAELHWIISDKNESITFEYMNNKAYVFENSVGVLTNNPTFEYHMMNLNNYMNISNDEPINKFSENIKLNPYSRGMGGIGLPGDLSSSSRFVKASFTKLNSVIPNSEIDSVGQMFHILGSVEQQEGCVRLGDKYERTQYTSCCNMDEGIYYYKTYDNSQINAVKMHNENLERDDLISYQMLFEQQIRCIN